MKQKPRSSRVVLVCALALAWSAISCLRTAAAVVAKEDFDGGAMNLVSGFDKATQNLDGGGGDWYGVGNRGAWPQTSGMPFSLVDDSVVSVSNPANNPFPTDSEAVFGQALALDNDFFAISDTREWTGATMLETPLMANWTFNVAGITNLSLAIDMGSMANEAFAYDAATLVEFKYQFDAGPVLTAMTVARDANTGGYAYRLMDSGLPQFSHANGALSVKGPATVTKTLVDSGMVSVDTVLDKSPPEGTGAGLLDTFKTPLTGTGSQLKLTMSTHFPFEAMAFDNIVIEGEGSVIVGVQGDYNNNGAVDAADYALWRNGGPLMNEGNNPGTVDQADYDFWRGRFGATTASGAAAAVPEPASMVNALILLVVYGVAGRRRQVRTSH